MISEPFRKIIRAGLYNPGSMLKRMKQMGTALDRQIAEGNEAARPFSDVIEEEIERYQRQLADKATNPDGPTRQTVRKLREDPVLYLLSRGTIDKDDQKAIEELRELRFKVTMGLTAGSGGTSGERVDTSTKTYKHPIERLTARQDALFVHVYKPWAEMQNKNGITLGKKRRTIDMTPFNLVVAVIEDGVPLTKLEGMHQVRNGSLSKPFVKAVRKFDEALRKAEHEGKVPRSRG